MVQEGYTPKKMAASGALFSGIGNVGGFLATTSGTLILHDGNVIGAAIVVDSMPVTAGVWHAIPFSFAGGCYAELGGGAAGTFGIFGTAG